MTEKHSTSANGLCGFVVQQNQQKDYFLLVNLSDCITFICIHPVFRLEVQLVFLPT